MHPLGADEPTAVGPYRLLGRLGSGGMGRVYLGRSAGGRTVAVKIVHPHLALDEEFRARFRREVEAASRVGGAWTAPVLDADPEAAVPWVATAYAAGPSLAAAVADGGALPAPSARALGAGLAEALTAVHELGLVHRDVKPSNVLLTLDGPLLIDFGIARAMDGTASLTSTGVSVGSPGYMSPEQILGKGTTGAADVFSLGAVLAYAATGEPPFSGDSSAALLYKVVHEEPELGSLGGDLREVAEACLAKDPASRPAPAEVSRRLAPVGAARLVAGGWLPGTLVEQVSRRAVELLNLETTAGPEPAPSGPVEFAGPSVDDVNGPAAGGQTPAPAWGPGAGAPVSTPAPPASSTGGSGSAFPSGVGVFGPAPVMGPAPVKAAGGAADTGPGGAAFGAPTVVPGTQDAVPPGRLTVSVSANSGPGDGGRGRRVSCTVALAVAGAVAAVSVGLGVLQPWSGGGTTEAGSSPATKAPTAADSEVPSASTDPGDGAGDGAGDPEKPGTIPARYLGTWEGEATGLGGAVAMGTFRVTVHQAGVGEELGTMRQTDQLGAVCTDVLTLKKVTKTQVLATAAGAKANHPGCNPTPHQVELTPVGDDLRYTSDSSAEGNPVSRMSKVG